MMTRTVDGHLAEFDDYAPVGLATYKGPVRDLCARRITHATTSHDAMMAEFYAARDAWERQAEAASLGYGTELAEYKAEHPMPRLADFMRARSS